MVLPHAPHGQSAKPRHHRPPKSSSSSGVGSCMVATLFLAFLVVVVLILFFTVFRPKDPKISVTGVQLPSFSLLPSNSSSSSSSVTSSASAAANASLVSFTFSQYVAVNNPNRESFSHFDSSLELLYAGNQVGFMFIPAGKISPGHTQYMAATFSVQSFPLSFSPSSSIDDGGVYGNLPGYGNNVGGADGGIPGYYGARMGPTLEIESRMEMGGRVRVLHFFTHNVASSADCRITITVADGSVLGFHC
ncbi:hypothetical protein MLD38_010844 [Melastoma candidum]|uniref:Uncharacterized protein n=1 Tax=Melastoma candidum TaxID=119954 RepID=A0ACB9R168_9MYRT|nr:hypothetical protein MLD38_010844 [Melastoma candidum]